jgi:hypothetical protein
MDHGLCWHQCMRMMGICMWHRVARRSARSMYLVGGCSLGETGGNGGAAAAAEVAAATVAAPPL